MRLTTSSLVALAVGLLVACQPALPQGQYGPYFPKAKELRLASGDVLPVYRVKLWQFSDGTSAVQLEYEPPFAVGDTEAVRGEARMIWPAFAPYVEAQQVAGAIITATNLRRAGIWPLAWTTTMKHYGVIVRRSADGKWYIDRDSVPLPATDGRQPRIIEPDGKPLPFDVTPSSS